jgi:hypothetical protein
MTKLITTASLLFLSALAFSQENYTVKMSMKIDGLPPEYAAYGEQETVTQIKGEKTRTEVTSMMGSQVIVFDGKTQTSLSDAMGNKTGFTATKEELETAEKSDKDAKPKIEYTTEKKTIAGYECTKAIIISKDKDKKENKMNVWVTDKIKHDMKGKRSGGRGMMDLGDLKGYPLEMEMSTNQNGMDMKIDVVATEVTTTPVDDSVFTVNTDGYKMLTFKDWQQKMKDATQGK